MAKLERHANNEAAQGEGEATADEAARGAAAEAQVAAEAQAAEAVRPRATVEARILAHPAVASVSDERAHGDGYWVILRDGAEDASNPGCGVIHEASPSACLRELQRNGVRWTQ